MKITVVYDKSTRKLIPFVYNNDGTVSITNYNNRENIEPIVSLVDQKYVDFKKGIVHIKED